MASGDTSTLPSSLVVTLHACRRALSVIRTVLGMPDYDRYLEHCRLRHPDQPVLSRSDYFAQYVARRYGSGPSRCC
ncbi:MAG: YbdD/YjiX family protein [Gemmatimonadetes bacterium]|nr:YbdD/YjiX family protein [Gemmatimonadota bacterium]